MWNAVKLIISQTTTLDWLLLALASILLLYIIGTWKYDYYSRQGFPSTKPKLPFVGDMLQFVLNREPLPDFVKKFYMRGKNHAIFGSFDFQKPAFMIRDPKMLKNVFIKQFDHFTNNRNIASESAEPLFGRNLFHLKDDEWRDMRATLSPAFTTSKIKGMFPLVSQCARQMVEHLNAKYKESTGDPGGLEVDMLEVFTRVANDIIATVAFGLEVDSLKDPKNEFYEMGKRLTTMSVWRLLGYFTFPKIMEKL